jgi:hypothetical protein
MLIVLTVSSYYSTVAITANILLVLIPSYITC